MDRRRLILGSVTLAAIACVAVGAWLPWLVFRPGYEGPARRLRAYNPLRYYVFKGVGWWALGLVALGAGNAADLSGRRDRAAGVSRAAGGAGVVLLVLLWVADRGSLDCLYVPGLRPATDCVYVYGPGTS